MEKAKRFIIIYLRRYESFFFPFVLDVDVASEMFDSIGTDFEHFDVSDFAEFRQRVFIEFPKGFEKFFVGIFQSHVPFRFGKDGLKHRKGIF